MRNHAGMTRQYIHMSKAWYGPDCLRLKGRRGVVDEVSFGLYDAGCGGTTGEMCVRWIKIGQPNGKPAPRLECFCDGWSAFATFGDVLAAMAECDGEDISPADFCALLASCGFEDVTPRVDPYARPAEVPA